MINFKDWCLNFWNWKKVWSDGKMIKMSVVLVFLLVFCILIYNVYGGGKGMVFSLKLLIYVRDSGMFMSDFMLNKLFSENLS